MRHGAPGDVRLLRRGPRREDISGGADGGVHDGARGRGVHVGGLPAHDSGGGPERGWVRVLRRLRAHDGAPDMITVTAPDGCG